MDLLKSKAEPAAGYATRTKRSSRTSDTLRTSTMHVTTSYGQQQQQQHEASSVWRGYLALFTVLLFAAHINITSGQIDWDDDDDPGEWEMRVASRTSNKTFKSQACHRARLDSSLSAVICINLQRFSQTSQTPDDSSMEIMVNLPLLQLLLHKYKRETGALARACLSRWGGGWVVRGRGSRVMRQS